MRPLGPIQRAALRLAQLIPKSRLHPAAVSALESSPGGWTVAFSGGADSLALLFLLWAHWPRRRRGLLALHFNHRLRGRAAAADARFAGAVALGLGVAFSLGTWRKPPGAPSAADARAARFAWIEGALRRRRRRVLCLGHQQDDIAETLLMRIARGSGTAGLAAPRPVARLEAGRLHVRPLLGLKKSELVAALRAAGVRWREDATNRGAAHLRNRMRGTVLPSWQAASGDRDVLAGAALSRERLEEDDAALECWVDRLKPLRGRILDVRTLRGQPPAVARRALHRWMLVQDAGARLSRAGFEALLEGVLAGQFHRQSFGPKAFAVIRGGRLSLRPSARVQ